MTLHAHDWFPVPEETTRVARAALRKGNVYMAIRDRLGFWYKDSDYARLFDVNEGRPAESPARLNPIPIIQFAEGLVDTGYMNADLPVTSRKDHDIDLCGPVMPDTRWQARSGAGLRSALVRH